MFIFSITVEAHRATFSSLVRRSAQVNLRYGSGSIGVEQIHLLGFKLDHGLSPLEKNLEMIQAVQFEDLKNRKAVRKFLGQVGFYRSLIPGFSEFADPFEESIKG